MFSKSIEDGVRQGLNETLPCLLDQIAGTGVRRGLKLAQAILVRNDQHAACHLIEERLQDTDDETLFRMAFPKSRKS